MLENSRAKIAKKNLDMIVANNLKVAGAGFGTDTNVITLIAELEDQFEVEIPAEEIIPENFNSAEGIWNLLQRIKGED